MKNIFEYILNFLIKFWQLTRNIGYMFVLLALAFVLFTLPDQADDFVQAIIEDFEIKYIFIFTTMLLFWSYITWYSSSIILDVSPTNFTLIEDFSTKKFNLFMGAVPFLIVANCFYQAKDFVSVPNNACFMAAGIVGLGVLFLFFLVYLEGRNDKASGKSWPTNADVHNHLFYKGEPLEKAPTIKEEIAFIKRFKNLRFYFFTLGLAFLLLLLLFCIPDVLIPISRELRPASVLALSFCFLTYLCTVLFYFHDINQRPFALAITALILICSLWNDNTAIPVIQNTKLTQEIRLTPDKAFEKWYQQKYKYWSLYHNDTNSMPVVFIATQGGGIRGELWTIDCINQLKQSFPDFSKYLFCMGGASGGTVGAAYYAAFCFDSLANNGQKTKINYEQLREFANSDCISPVTAAYAFGENLQRFFPCPFPWLDRSKIMMQAFSKSYAEYLGRSTADSGLLSLYYPSYNRDSFNVNIPSIFINGVLAETGQRVITSNLNISQSKNFEHDIDFFTKVKADISVATASLKCMRFPLLLSGGLFYDGKYCNKIGHIADGGYRENTGLQAMYSLLSELYPRLKSKKVRPILIYLRNGENELKEDSSKPIRLLHEIGTPFSALMHVNGTSAPALGMMKMIAQQKANGNPFKMRYGEIWLHNKNYHTAAKFPLGLYMSRAASQRLKERADSIEVVNTAFFDELKECFR